MKHILVIACALLLHGTAIAFAVEARVETVNGCDSIIVVDGSGSGLNVRLFGVECPRPAQNGRAAQPFADEALDFLRALLPKGAPVIIHDMRRDLLGREKGYTITLPGNRLVQAELARAGLAWISPTHCGACREWKRLEKEAREAGRGLWRDAEPVPPWEWGK